MKNRVIYVSLFLVFFSAFPLLSFSQEWVRTYSSNNNSVFTRQLVETYDRGYILGSDMTVGYSGFLKIGWVIKLDVNGNILWNKKLGNGTQIWEIEGINETPDGGLVVTGGADTLNNMWYDAWVTKLSACGEIEWCKILHSADGLYCGHSIISLNDNSYLLLLSNWGTFPETSTWLMHLDPTGGIIWEQEYFATDTLISSEEPKDLILCANGNYLITGTCDYPDSGTISPWWIQPMLIMADSSGQAVWELPWGYAQNGGGEGFQSVVSGNTNSVYTSISRYPHGTGSGYKPALIKTSATGVPGSIYNLKDSTEFGKASTITNSTDTVLFVGAQYRKNGFDYLSVFKTDTLGNILKEKVLSHSEYIPQDAILTEDGKYLVTAADLVANKYVIKLWKLNSNLEYDSIYTQPFTYDSLCPHAIVSDTLFFQCDLITGMQEPAKNTERVKMRVFPNPASGAVHVQMPECIQRETQTTHLTVTTVFHRRYKDLQLAVYDPFGRRVFEQAVKPGETEVILDVSRWSRGLYLLRLQYLDTVVATEKMVAE